MTVYDSLPLRNLAGRVLSRNCEPGTDREAYELAAAVRDLLNADPDGGPTQWAYDQACKALAKHRAIADEATELLLRLGMWGLDRSKQDELLVEARQLRSRFDTHRTSTEETR